MHACVGVCVCVTHSHSNCWRSLNTPGLRADIKFLLRNLRERAENEGMDENISCDVVSLTPKDFDKYKSFES